MTFPVTEHTVKTDRHTTGYLACGPQDGTLAGLLPRLARALAVVAAPAAGLRGARLPLRRARHARLRPLEHLYPPRGLRAGADRAGHARAARRPSAATRRCGSATTGAARWCGTWRRTIRQDRRRGQPVRALHPGLHARRAAAADRPQALSRGRVSGRPVGLPVFYEENFEKARRASRPTSATRESPVPQGQSRGRRQARLHRRRCAS